MQRIVHGSTSAKAASRFFKQLGKTLKSAVLDLLYQLTVKSWIINIGAGMAGMSPAAFAAQMGTNYLGGGSGLIGAAAGYLGAGEFYGGLTGSQMGPWLQGTAGYYGCDGRERESRCGRLR
jgi:hypothetical protein